MTTSRFQTHSPSTRTLWLTVLVVALVYVWGIDNLYMPNNGDEMIYAHIARMTAATGQWLPLVSDYSNLRNTKPPVLFWQSMLVTGWGQYWQLWLIRLPSIIYLALVSAGMAMLLRRWLGEWRTAAWAVLCFLLCWGTFRYGRPYMTTAPEMFWYSLAPGFVLWRAANAQTRDIQNTWDDWRWWTLLGLLTGIGLAYKSFALVAPVAAGTWLLRLFLQTKWSWRAVVCNTAQMAWMSLLAVGLFACWLLIDPQPQEVWREFVQQENAGKMSDGRNYFAVMFSFNGSADYLAAPMLNSGLLFPWVLALVGVAWRQRGTASEPKRSLLTKASLLWIAVWWVVFLLPNHRSSRYLLPLLPALALLMALHVDSIKRVAPRVTGLLALIMLSVLVWLGWHARAIGVLPDLLAGLVLVSWVAGLVIWVRMWWIPSTGVFDSLLCAALALLSLTALLQGMHGERVDFQGDSKLRPQADTIWVSQSSNGEFEPLHFLLPGDNRFTSDQARVEALTNGTDTASGTWFMVVRLDHADPLPCETMNVCERIATRWDIELRPKPGQANADNINRPREWLWRQEWLMRVR